MSKFHIKGFRRLANIELEMRSPMVMIGANGVGKSSMLDALCLLSGSASGTLNQKVNNMGGLSNMMTKDSADELSISIDMGVLGHRPLEYELHLKPRDRDTGYAISEEILCQDRGQPKPFKHIESHYDDIKYFEVDQGKLVRPNWDYKTFETSLSQVPKMFKEPEEFRRMLSAATKYHVLDVGDKAPVRLPQMMRPAELPGEQGEELFAFLYSLSQSDPDRYEVVIDSIKAAFNGFKELKFPLVAAGMVAMTWSEKYFSTPIYMNQLSEGTLRFIWLASLLLSPGLTSVTMIDEPEVSLHPELLSLLADLMREASERTQLIVATHSDRLIGFLKPNEVVVMDLDEKGHATATWADSLNLDEWLKEYSLDEVWRMGRMGGRA
jgi:predicted ATPase